MKKITRIEYFSSREEVDKIFDEIPGYEFLKIKIGYDGDRKWFIEYEEEYNGEN